MFSEFLIIDSINSKIVYSKIYESEPHGLKAYFDWVKNNKVNERPIFDEYGEKISRKSDKNVNGYFAKFEY